MLAFLLSTLARSSARHPRLFLAAGLCLTVLSALLVPRLEVLSSRSAMNPRGLPVIDRYEAHLKDFGSSGKLILVLDGDPAALAPFADELAPTLLGPGSPVKTVFHRLDLDFVRRQLFLFLPEPVLRSLTLYLESHRPALQALVQGGGLPWLAGNLAALIPADLATAGDTADDPLGPLLDQAATQLTGRLTGTLSAPALPQVLSQALADRAGVDATGHFVSRDKGLLFIFVSPLATDDSQEAIRPFVEFCRAKAADLSAQWRARGAVPPKVALAGLPAMTVEEADSLKSDTALTVAAASVAILLIIVFGFGSFRRGLLIFIPLLAAGVWNLGLTVFTVGHLNMLTSSFLAVLFGLGVDYGIFITSRFLEERKPDLPLDEVAARALSTAGRTVLTAGGTTGLAFLALYFNPYQGFSELGIVAGVGVLCVVLAYLTLMPALLVLVPLGPEPRRRLPSLATLLPLARPFPIFSLFITLGALALCALSILEATRLPLDFDVRNLMPKNSQSTHYTFEMTSRSDFQAEFVVSEAPTLAESRRRAEAFAALPTVARVDSLTALLPTLSLEQEALLARLAPALKDLAPTPPQEPSVLAFLDGLSADLEDLQERAFAARRGQLASDLDGLLSTLEDLRAKAEKDQAIQQRFSDLSADFTLALGDLLTLASQTPTRAPTLAEVPPLTRDSFVGASGAYAVMVYPKESVYQPAFLDRFMAQVYSVDPQATGYPATHQVVSKLMFEGFLRATFLALAVVFFMLLLEFRNLRRTLSAFFPLVVGGLLMFGVMHLTSMSLNFANIVALPLVLGLAVDYGVFLTHRLMERPTESPFLVALSASRPVVLAALTTAGSIGALTLGQHQGAASLGKVLIFGIFTCLLAALVVLPAVTTLLRRFLPRKPKTGVTP
jgi:hopanoid biosynthesis associated RND transporter like protein HpnN